MANRRAVVVGGSLAGLCAGSALIDHFEKVVVVDRDAYPAEPGDRAGVPQARHVHALLVRGRREYNSLFPGFDERMRKHGALELDPYVRALVQSAPDSFFLRHRFGEVLQLVRPASHLYSPGVIARVAYLAARRRIRSAPEATEPSAMPPPA